MGRSAPRGAASNPEVPVNPLFGNSQRMSRRRKLQTPKITRGRRKKKFAFVLRASPSFYETFSRPPSLPAPITSSSTPPPSLKKKTQPRPDAKTPLFCFGFFLRRRTKIGVAPCFISKKNKTKGNNHNDQKGENEKRETQRPHCHNRPGCSTESILCSRPPGEPGCGPEGYSRRCWIRFRHYAVTFNTKGGPRAKKRHLFLFPAAAYKNAT